MSDISQRPPSLVGLWRRVDKAWLTIVLIPLLLAAFDPSRLWPTIAFAGGAIAQTGVFIVFAVLAVASRVITELPIPPSVEPITSASTKS